MTRILTANELKTKGVTAIKKATSDNTEALITVRGKTEYVVLPIKQYNHLRECELEVAVMESRKDLENGRFVEESVEEHIKRITGV
jgi:PHD/YefM family antitoxin component YafN of YafNO toxin-antitoxin module